MPISTPRWRRSGSGRATSGCRGWSSSPSARTAAWEFLRGAAPRFIPDAIDSATDDEAAFDCAMVLLGRRRGAGARDGGRAPAGGRRSRGPRAVDAPRCSRRSVGARVPRSRGSWRWRSSSTRGRSTIGGSLASGRKFVERAFGMKAPAPFAAEPAPLGGLFDFSSTTATRVLAVIAAEGNTPFVGAWLRERIAAGAPRAFTPRRLDENSWNACVAWALGRGLRHRDRPAVSGGLHGDHRRDRAPRPRPRRRAGPRRYGPGGGDDADVLLRAGGRRTGDARKRQPRTRRGGERAWPLTGTT